MSRISSVSKKNPKPPNKCIHTSIHHDLQKAAATQSCVPAPRAAVCIHTVQPSPFPDWHPSPSSFSSGNNSSPVHGWVSLLKQRALMDGWHLKGQQEQQLSFIFFITTALSGFYTLSCFPALYSLHLPICASAVMAAKCHQRRKWLMRLALPQISDSSHALRNQTTFRRREGWNRLFPLYQVCALTDGFLSSLAGCKTSLNCPLIVGGVFWGHSNVERPSLCAVLFANA